MEACYRPEFFDGANPPLEQIVSRWRWLRGKARACTELQACPPLGAPTSLRCAHYVRNLRDFCCLGERCGR